MFIFCKVNLFNISVLVRLIEPLNLEKAVDLYQKAAGVFEVRISRR